jgi:VWFA-related protein
VDRLRVLPPPAEPLPADLYTNRYELKGGVPTSATAVLFDLLNTRMRDRYFARDEFAKFLRKQLQPADRVALYVLGHDLRLVHDFTSDSGELLRALEVSRRAVALLDSFDPEKDANGNTSKADQVISDLHAVSRVHQTVGALEAIGNRLAALPGRKNLVWVTGGTPFYIGMEDQRSQQQKKYEISRLRLFNEELERAARRLDAADVAVYPVDAQGLLAMAGPRAGLPENFMAARDTMKILAARTGGRATLDSNDIAGAVRRALDDSKITYTLSYQPTHEKWDGRFQPIKVAVKRPGVTLHHRGGYFATADESAAPANREEALNTAIANPVEATNIRLVVAIKEDTPTAGRLAVRTLIDPADLRLVLKDGRWTGQFDIAYVQQATPQGASVAVTKHQMDLKLAAEAYRKALDMGIVAQDHLNAASSAYRLRVVVRDVTTGATGTVEVMRRKPAGAAK